MITNGDIIRDSLGLIGILSEDENPSASQSQLGLRRMNDLLARLQIDLDLQYFPQTVLADETPLPEFAVGGIKAGLAIDMCPDFGREPPGALVAMFGAFLAQQTRDTVRNSLTEADLLGLARGEGQDTVTWDITSG